MATKLNTGELFLTSGINYLDVYQGAKTLSEIEETDWIEVQAFREGTFNFTGDEQTITEHKTENGTAIGSSIKDGTYGFEGDGVDIGKEAAMLLLKMEDLSTSAATGWLLNKNTIKYSKVGKLENVKVRLRFEQGAYSSIVYPNASLLSRLQGSGSTEDFLTMKLQCSAASSNDALLGAGGGLFLLVGKE